MKCVLLLLIRLISLKKYWRKAKKLALVCFKWGDSSKIYFYEILLEIQTKEKRLNFLKTIKTRFRKNSDFRGLCVSLTKAFFFFCSNLISLLTEY